MDSASESAVFKRLESAKLSREGMIPPTQTVFYDEQGASDLILIEADPELLAHVENEQKTLTIRGSKDDNLVICSDDKTYLVREAGISNSLLLVPDFQFVKSKNVSKDIEIRNVSKTCHVYWEPKPMRPSARKLYSLLESNPYRGDELEDDTERPLQKNNLESLLECVQASRSELLDMIKSLPIVFIGNQYRLLEFGYQCRLVEFILTSIESNSMKWSEIQADVITKEVSELEPPSVVEQIVNWYIQDGVLNTAALCRTQGEALLKNASSFKLNDFMQIWKQSLPEDIEPDISYLYGISYVSFSTPSIINYLSVWDLPEPESERFDHLLRLKTAWTLDEIEPFIRDLTLKGVSALLLKYARAFVKDGQTFYSKK